MRPIVRTAIAALDHFGVADRDQAVALIAMWSRYSELSDADLIEAVSAFDPAYDTVSMTSTNSVSRPSGNSY